MEVETQQAEVDESGDVFVPNEGQQEPVLAAKEAPSTAEAIDPELLAEIAGEDKPKMIPHSRFNEVNESLKTERAARLALEEELARAKGGAGAEKPSPKDEPHPFDYDAAEDLYAAALIDGETAKAKQIRADIRKHERAEAVAEAERAADARFSASKAKDSEARATQDRDTALAQAYAAFPFLDSNHADADQEAIEEALALTNHYVGKGMSIGEALGVATKKVGPRYAPAPAPAAATPAAPALPDLAKALERDGKIPAKPSGLGARATEIDVSKMTSTELKALSAEDEARLAGDIL